MKKSLIRISVITLVFGFAFGASAHMTLPFTEAAGYRSDPSVFKSSFGKNMMYGYGMPYFGGGLSMLFMIFIWLILIVGTVGVVRWVFGSGKWQEHGSALDILKERYAKGEIDKKEFEEKKRDLV